MNLDDLNGIKRNDRNNMMMSLEKFVQNTLSSINKAKEINVPSDYSKCEKIVTVGTGGDGIPGDFLRFILNGECSVPIVAAKDYKLPKFIDDKALVFAVSYSGTTDETIIAFHKAIKFGAKILGITSGNRFLELLQELNIPFFQAPAGRTTRESLACLLFSMITIIQKLGFIKNKYNEISDTITILNELLNNYKPENLLANNIAQKIALKNKG